MPPYDAQIENLIIAEEEHHHQHDHTTSSSGCSSNSDKEMIHLPLTTTTSNHQHHHPIDASSLKTNKNKRVTFARTARVKNITHINDLKQKININAIWYTKKDYDSFKIDCKRTIRINQCNQYYHQQYNNDINDVDNTNANNNNLLMMMLNDYNNKTIKDSLCIRGLEDQLSIENEIGYDRVVYESVRVVLEEQLIQRMEGINDSYTLAMKYSKQCYQSTIDAHFKALKDYQDIINLHNDEKRISNILSNMITELAHVI